MQQMTDELRSKFMALQKNGDLIAMICELNQILKSNTSDDMLTGFCYWNLSDCYAMRRMAQEEYQNHRQFADFIEGMPKQYQFWCVCDATQRFTLESGGYGEFWQQLYQNAVRENTEITDCEAVAFESHRAAFLVSPAIKVSESTVEFAAQSFKDFLDMAQYSESIDFYRLIFASLCLRNFGETDVCIEDLCRVMLLQLKENASPRVFAAGEWDAINGKRGKQNEASVGLNAVINSLIDIGRIKEANELYITAKKHGMKSNAYIERRFKV